MRLALTVDKVQCGSLLSFALSYNLCVVLGQTHWKTTTASRLERTILILPGKTQPLFPVFPAFPKFLLIRTETIEIT